LPQTSFSPLQQQNVEIPNVECLIVTSSRSLVRTPHSSWPHIHCRDSKIHRKEITELLSWEKKKSRLNYTQKQKLKILFFLIKSHFIHFFSFPIKLACQQARCLRKSDSVGVWLTHLAVLIWVCWKKDLTGKCVQRMSTSF
jgi:hypothetical protein